VESVKEYAWENIASALLDLYGEVLEEAAGATAQPAAVVGGD
jgi:hypothetical protein